MTARRLAALSTLAAALALPACVPGQDDFDFISATVPEEASAVNDGMFFVTQRVEELASKGSQTAAEKKELAKLRAAVKRTERLFKLDVRSKKRAKIFGEYLLLVIASRSPSPDVAVLPQNGAQLLRNATDATIQALGQESQQVRESFTGALRKVNDLLDKANAADESGDAKQELKALTAAIATATLFAAVACD